jgi:hypothetical protein
MQQKHYLVPDQSQGFEKNIEHSTLLSTTEDAEDGFVGAKERLLDVSNWNKYVVPAVRLQLTDLRKKALHRKAHKGDCINIEVESTWHWVLVEAIEYDDYPDEGRETFAVRLRPITAAMDTMEGNDPINATATIVIDRTCKKLTASYHGRNEAMTWIGLSDEQWGSLVKGLIG